MCSHFVRFSYTLSDPSMRAKLVRTVFNPGAFL
jgi:hypothetical protein